MRKNRRRRRCRYDLFKPALFLFGASFLLLSSVFFLLLPMKKPALPAQDAFPLLMLAPAPNGEASVAAQSTHYENPVLKVYDTAQKRIVEQTLEEYVLCVVAGEMPMSYGDEALKAQAVAARTLAVYKMRARGGKGCSAHPGADVCTDSGHCQAYKKSGSSDSRLVELVAQTVGQIITYGGAPIEVFYHSTSGGRTEDVRNVFAEQRPYLVSVSSPGEESAPRYTGEIAVSRASFIKKINSAYPKANLKDKTLIDSVGAVERNASGRVAKVRVGEATATGVELRKLFGLNSANFTIELSAKQVIFHTIGYGHGVGMSQAGADAMARAGSSYLDIVRHYYVGAEIGGF